MAAAVSSLASAAGCAGGGAPLFLGVGRDVLAFGRDALRSAMRSALTRVGLETFEDVAAFAERDASVEERESLSFPFVGFALLFAFLVVFKLAFGVALHWFGAHMLDTLPKDVGGGGEKEKEKARRAASRRRRATSPSPPTRGAIRGRACSLSRSRSDEACPRRGP